MPYAIKPMVEKEVRRLVEEGVLEPTRQSEWSTPVVTVLKEDGTIRLAADFKISINQYLSKEHYPLPNPKDIFATLAGGKVFCSLDLSEAYLQLPVAKESQKLLTVNTSLGLFTFTRLPYGVTTGPAIFQSVMDQILHKVAKVACYLDNILISGETEEECYERLITVLERLRKHNIRVRTDKCEFLVKSVKYLGYVISEKGLQPNSELVQAIKLARQPQNKQELIAYVGLLNFYGSFIQNLSVKLAGLYELLTKDTVWNWTEECAKIFEESKEWVCADNILTFYDPEKPLRLTCDAAPGGVGTVLSHVIRERPISFASKTLSAAERNYSQLERESLAIIFGLKKFHEYLYGRYFEIVTDHAPLIVIFGEKKAVPSMAAARLQRWAILLAAYDYKIMYKKGSEIANADALSRLPLASNEQVEQQNNRFSSVKYQRSLRIVLKNQSAKCLEIFLYWN